MNIEKELIEEEGLSLSCYKDTEGFWTIGVGHLLKSPCDDISLEEAGRLLKEDIRIAQSELREKIPVYAELDQVRKYVLLSMAYNMGIRKLLTFKKMLLALENRNYELAAVEMKDSKWARQVKRRADKLINLMKKGA
jgi:lysozyme